MSYDRILIRACQGLILPVLLLITIGCTGPIKFAYAPPDGAPVKKIQGRPTVIVETFVDARPGGFLRPWTIGKITSLVVGLNSRTVTLSEKTAAAARDAFVKELQDAGFVVISGDQKLTNSDFVLDGAVKDFRLDVGPRDDLSISIMTKLTEKTTGSVVWSDTVSEKRNDYIGIWGETRGHIARYISAALSKVARKSIDGMVERISAPAGVAPAGAAAPQMEEGAGRLTVATDPTRAEIYVEDVYYGLAPLSIELKAGVYTVTAKKQGYRDAMRKVSVRQGETTEADLTLEKQ